MELRWAIKQKVDTLSLYTCVVLLYMCCLDPSTYYSDHFIILFKKYEEVVWKVFE